MSSERFHDRTILVPDNLYRTIQDLRERYKETFKTWKSESEFLEYLLEQGVAMAEYALQEQQAPSIIKPPPLYVPISGKT